MSDDSPTGSAGRMQVPRTRGAVSGFALIVLGAWGALAPFIGPYFDFAITPRPGTAWHWTASRGWFEVLPGGVAALGGVLLLVSANRAMTLLGAWIAVLAGGWFVVGPQVAPLLTLGVPGAPASDTLRTATAESLAFFTALGALIVLFGGLAAGRLSVRSVRDARAAARRDAAAREAEVQQLDTARAAGEGQPAERTDPPPTAPAVAAAPSDAEPDVDTRAADSREGAVHDDEVHEGAVHGSEVHEGAVREGAVHDAEVREGAVREGAVRDAEVHDGEVHDREVHDSGTPAVATSENSHAPYAPDGHTPEGAALPADVTPQPGGPAYAAPHPRGPAYATPQRYVRPEPPQQPEQPQTHQTQGDQPPA